ncbi:unnamed protein product [Schistosoma haematobium]|nr:unnamed protein product [Schistosoma haematobium]
MRYVDLEMSEDATMFECYLVNFRKIASQCERQVVVTTRLTTTRAHTMSCNDSAKTDGFIPGAVIEAYLGVDQASIMSIVDVLKKVG